MAKGPNEEPTIVMNAAQSWRAAGYQIGWGSGHVEAQGISYDSSYGEYSEFSFSG